MRDSHNVILVHTFKHVKAITQKMNVATTYTASKAFVLKHLIIQLFLPFVALDM